MRNAILYVATLLIVGSCCSLLPGAIDHELDRQTTTHPDVSQDVVMSWIER